MAKAHNNRQSDREELSASSSYDIPICGPGTEIAHFRIEKEIGREGRGGVYLPHDTKLDRNVAIRSLPPIMSNDGHFRTAKESKEEASKPQLIVMANTFAELQQLAPTSPQNTNLKGR